jgi:hypothetical protein
MGLPRVAVVYDAGALVAAERGSDRFRVLHNYCLQQDVSPVVPAPVLAQAWRGSSRQVHLVKALRGCFIEATSEMIARNAGLILGRAKCSDAVDAIVVATALARDALVVTSDPDDIALLWGASGIGSKPPAIVAV